MAKNILRTNKKESQINQPPFSTIESFIFGNYKMCDKIFIWETFSQINKIHPKKPMKISKIVCFLLFTNIFAISCAKEWNWKIEGIIYCSNFETRKWEGLKGAQVEFLEHDTLDPNDHLGKTTTNVDGKFKISGKESEFTDPEPFFEITHKCKDPTKPLKNNNCFYKTTFSIPFQPEQQFLSIGLGEQEYGFSQAMTGKSPGNIELKIKTEVKC